MSLSPTGFFRLVLALGAGSLISLPIVEAQEPVKQSADVILHSVKAQSTKEDGSAWDILGGAPDLFVTIGHNKKGGATYTSAVKEDTFEATYGVDTIRVTVGDEIEISVYDKDTRLNDLVGKIKIKITQDILSKRTKTWDFDRVSSLVLEFEP